MRIGAFYIHYDSNGNVDAVVNFSKINYFACDEKCIKIYFAGDTESYATLKNPQDIGTFKRDFIDYINENKEEKQ